MKTPILVSAQKAKYGTSNLPSLTICMHVWGSARNDVRVMREAAALAKEGFKVLIVDVEGEQNQQVKEEIDGIHVRHILMPNSFTSTRFKKHALLRAGRVFFKGVFQLISISADTYHAHDLTALPGCFVAALLRRKPLVFDSHELPISNLGRKSRFVNPLYILLKLLLIGLVPLCDVVISVSPPILKHFQDYYHSKKVSLIRNVPPYRVITKSDRLRKHLGLSSDTRIALYQGGLQDNRSLERLVLSAPFLNPNIIIVMMGPNQGTTQSELEALIAKEKVSDRVKILPPVPYEELLDWTVSADIGLVVFSLDYSLSIRWCLPNKLFEYLMVGLPILSSQLDAVAEVVNTYNVGSVVPSLTPMGVAEAINRLLEDQDALIQMQHNALNIAQKEFCWEKECNHLIRLYRDIMLEHGLYSF